MNPYDITSVVFAILLSTLGGLVVGFFVRGKSINPESEVGKTWRTQDWIWLFCFLLYAQVFTVLYKDMVMGVVSYVSTFVSIALGAVAIYISVREATKGDKVKDQMNLILGELREKLSQMDTKINRIDPEYSAVRDLKIDEITEQIKGDIENSLNKAKNISTEQVIDIVNDQVQKATDDLKSSLNLVDANILNKSHNLIKFSEFATASMTETRKYVGEVINSMNSGTKFTVVSLRSIIGSVFRVNLLVSAIYQVIERLIHEGVVEDLGSNYFSKK